LVERALAWFVALFLVRIDSDIPSYLTTEYRCEITTRTASTL